MSKKSETVIQNNIITYLKIRDWYVKSTHGNVYSMGFPDLYACHKRYGTRWIEVKNPINYSFTPAQMDVFPEFAAKGVGIWILVAATDSEYNKLFGHPNWYTYLSNWKV
jgi:O-phosphoseryl-tRNA(Cys) synthetase